MLVNHGAGNAGRLGRVGSLASNLCSEGDKQTEYCDETQAAAYEPPPDGAYKAEFSGHVLSM